MIAYETNSTILMVDKIECYKLYSDYVIRFNNELVYKHFSNKEDSEIAMNELRKLFYSEKLKIIKKDDE